MNYQDYRFQDFITDAYFIKWVKHPDLESDHFWQTWIKNHPDQTPEIRQAREFLQRMEFNVPQPAEKDQQEVLDRLLSSSRRTKTLQKSIWPVWLKAAAVFVLLCGLAYVFYNQVTYEPEVISSTPEYKQETKENPRGVKSRFYLPDGTLVHLNADSKITFTNPFKDSVRLVELTGEAYFEGISDPKRPLKVKTGEIVTEAIGTAFNIRSFETGSARVALTEGKVRVWQQNQEVFLNPGFQVTFSDQEENYKLGEFDLQSELAWTRGDIYLENASFAEVVSTLERWYGVKFEYEAAPSERWNYNGVFRNNSSLERVLDRLGFSKNFNYQLDGKKVIIKFNQ